MFSVGLSISTEKAKEDVQEATSSLAAAKESSVDAAVETVLSDLCGILALKEEQKKQHQRLFWDGKVVFVSPWLASERVLLNAEGRNLLQDGDAHLGLHQKLLLTDSNASKKNRFCPLHQLDMQNKTNRLRIGSIWHARLGSYSVNVSKSKIKAKVKRRRFILQGESRGD